MNTWLSSWERVPHLQFILLSVAASIVTLALKFGAYHLTGSVGLLSDAVESTANVAAAFTALFALWYASRPADKDHPYGHEKIEFFSSGIEGGLILVAAATIGLTAWKRLFQPALPEHIGNGLILTLLSTAINFWVGRSLLVVGQRVDSIILEADGHHLLTDVWTSLAVALGLVLVAWTHIPWIDPLLALLVALNILRIGYDLLRRSFHGLMDRGLDETEIQQIRSIIDDSLQEGMTYHALRTRRAGAHRFADFHLLFPGHISVRAAHDLEMKIEQAIQAIIPGIEITTHIEPIEEPQAWNDYIVTNDEALPIP